MCECVGGWGWIIFDTNGVSKVEHQPCLCPDQQRQQDSVISTSTGVEHFTQEIWLANLQYDWLSFPWEVGP